MKTELGEDVEIGLSKLLKTTLLPIGRQWYRTNTNHVLKVCYSKTHIRPGTKRFFFGIQKHKFEEHYGNNLIILFICGSLSQIAVVPASILSEWLQDVPVAQDGSWKFDIYKYNNAYEMLLTGKERINLDKYMQEVNHSAFIYTNNIKSEKQVSESRNKVKITEDAISTASGDEPLNYDIDSAIAQREVRYSSTGIFDPKSVEDARDRIVGSIVRRRGQPQFRKLLLNKYKGRCAITGTNLEETLEAAHIYPYQGPDTNHPTNGIILRADIHVLFDLGLIGIDTKDFTVIISTKLQNTDYQALHGRKIYLPEEIEDQPNIEALNIHRRKMKQF